MKIFNCFIVTTVFLMTVAIYYMGSELSTIKTQHAEDIESIKARQDYMYRLIQQIDNHAATAADLAESSWDAVHGAPGKWHWVEGKTTKEIEKQMLRSK